MFVKSDDVMPQFSPIHFKHTVTMKQIKYKEKLTELLILGEINRTEDLI